MPPGIPSFPTLLLETDGAIATVTLNRPDALNAIDVAMAQDLLQAAQWLQTCPGTRVVLLRAAGKAFCAGGDISMFEGDADQVRGTLLALFAPLNDFIKSKGLGEMDRGGALGRAGTVDEARLAKLLQHPYLTKPYPKSLDRFDFGAAMADGMNAEDGAALLTAFTAAAVGKALDLLPRRPKKLVVSGGGRHNPTMMAMLASRAGVEVVQAETLGWSGDAVEAECFAFLAVRVLRGLPISFPSTTGAPQPMRGGKLAG